MEVTGLEGDCRNHGKGTDFTRTAETFPNQHVNRVRSAREQHVVSIHTADTLPLGLSLSGSKIVQ